MYSGSELGCHKWHFGTSEFIQLILKSCMSILIIFKRAALLDLAAHNSHLDFICINYHILLIFRADNNKSLKCKAYGKLLCTGK